MTSIKHKFSYRPIVITLRVVKLAISNADSYTLNISSPYGETLLLHYFYILRSEI